MKVYVIVNLDNDYRGVYRTRAEAEARIACYDKPDRAHFEIIEEEV